MELPKKMNNLTAEHGDTIAYSALAILMEKMAEYQDIAHKVVTLGAKGEAPSLELYKELQLANIEVDKAMIHHQKTKAWALEESTK